jgi:hypothetical protein
MNRFLFSFCLLIALCVGVQAQGTFSFTWHGQSNYFQASFILTDAEMQPGAVFSSPDFTNSVSVKNPSGVSYNFKDDSTFTIGGVNPWSWEIGMIDFARGSEIFMNGGEPPRGGMAGTIEEKLISGSDLFYEKGFWTVTSVPEPSLAALASIGVLFAAKKGCTI